MKIIEFTDGNLWFSAAKKKRLNRTGATHKGMKAYLVLVWIAGQLERICHPRGRDGAALDDLERIESLSFGVEHDCVGGIAFDVDDD